MWNSAESTNRLFLVIGFVVAVTNLASLVLPFSIVNSVLGSWVIFVVSYILAFRSRFLAKAENKLNKQRIAHLEKKAKRRLPVRNSAGKTFYLPPVDVPEEE